MPLSSKFTVRLELPAFPIESLHMPTLLFGQGARDRGRDARGGKGGFMAKLEGHDVFSSTMP